MADERVECVHDAIVVWQDAEGSKLQNDFGWQLEPDGEEGSLKLSMNMVAPARVASAAVHLVFHWSPQGAVTWQRATLAGIPCPEPRLVTVSVLSIAAGRARPNTGQSGHWLSRGTFIISPEGYVLSNSDKMGPEVQTRTIDLGRSLKGSVTLGGCGTWNDVWRAARRPQLYAPLTNTLA